MANLNMVSKEMIKPSSPTANQRRNLKLCFLDQIAPPFHVPVFFFYQASQISRNNYKHAKMSKLLKSSLSRTLTRFYPLAGRISEDFSIDCNDAGALYVEVRVHADLSPVVQRCNADELRQWLPLESNGQDGGVGEKHSIPLAVQINFFDCGGMAIAVEISHKIADATSLATFVSTWAAICRGDEEISQPSFNAASFFPPRDLTGPDPLLVLQVAREKMKTKCVVFDKEKLAKLKECAAAGPESQVKDPTRLELVTAWIWRRFTEIHKAIMGKNATLPAMVAVNLRSRLHPPLSAHAFGNLFVPACAVPSSGWASVYQNLVCELRNSIRAVDNYYVNKVLESGAIIQQKALAELLAKGVEEFCFISSWCRLPLYEANYGCGKPFWVCPTCLPYKNTAFLMDNRCGDGIVAWINMLEEDSSFFGSDQHNENDFWSSS